MSLTDLQVKNARQTEKRYTLSDGRGLLLEVRTSGAKVWVLRRWHEGREIRRVIGKYPDIGLKEARAKAAEMRAAPMIDFLCTGVKQTADGTFAALFEEWLQTRMKNRSASYIRDIRRFMNADFLPLAGGVPITDITALSILSICRRAEQRGAVTVARRVLQITGQVMRYAVATGRIDYDPTPALWGAMQNQKVEHHKAITDPAEIGALIRAIRSYPQVLTRSALLLAAYTFVRPGEIRRAEWCEISFDSAEWRIPAEKMKMRRPHVVPLAPQVLDLLRKLHELTGDGRWVFRNLHNSQSYMGKPTMIAALRRLGISAEKMTIHGFRGMASTRLNELGYSADIIERQLAHVEENRTRAAYNHAEYMTERRRMMNEWADYLDRLAETEEKEHAET